MTVATPAESIGTLLNVAATCAATRALGPGLRAAVWVQGCPFRCPGCIAPEWIPYQVARLVTPEDLAGELLVVPGVTGLTFSGGEPMLQASALAQVIRLCRRRRDLSLICFTGFRLERLLAAPLEAGVRALLAEVDVLIDGQYISRLNDGQGLRGSRNQRIHRLTDRIRAENFDFEMSARRVELRIRGPESFLVGVPPLGLRDVIADAERQISDDALADVYAVPHGGGQL